MALSLVIALFAFNATISYLADYERKDNVVTIGNVEIEIDEGKYEDSSTVAAGSTLPKAPSIKNIGINDTYVFFKVAIPKKEVTLLYEETTKDTNNVKHKEGTKYDNMPKEAELFKTIAEGTSAAKVSTAGYNNAGADLSAPDVIVGYNKGVYNSATPENSTAGWVYLGSNQNQTIDTKNYDVYYFGYNKKLTPKPANAPNTDTSPRDYWTTTLFDQIQLKSFIDEELIPANQDKQDVDVKVLVDAYGIQADNLGITLPDGILSDDDVKSVFEIVQRKGVS